MLARLALLVLLVSTVYVVRCAVSAIGYYNHSRQRNIQTADGRSSCSSIGSSSMINISGYSRITLQCGLSITSVVDPLC